MPDQSKSLNIHAYAERVIDTYRAQVRYSPDEKTAVANTIHSHAKRASDQGLSTLRDAAAIATNTIKSYNAARDQRIDHLVARQQAAQKMAERYDQQGRDTQRRQQSQSLSR